MTRTAVLFPLLAMVLLTLLAWAAMLGNLAVEMRRRGLRPSLFASRTSAAAALRNTRAADDFQNLFEMPVLFYAAVLVLYAADRVDGGYLALAWSYVVLRYVHSTIHITYNYVPHRFTVWVLSCLVLWALWGRFAVQLLS